MADDSSLVRDSDLQQACGKLQASEETYRLLFDADPPPMWLYDCGTLAFLAVNDAAIRLYGYTRDEFLSMTIRDIRPPSELPRLVDHLLKRDNRAQPYKGFRHRSKAGRIIDVEVFSHATSIAGRPAALVIARDVTERLREHSLADESKLWKTLMDNIPDTIYFKDTQSRFTRINEAQRRVLGVARTEDAIGKTDRDFFSPEHAADALNDEQEIVRSGEPLVGKIEKVTLRDGTLRWFSTTKIPIKGDDNSVTGIIGSSRDVSELKQAEGLQSAIYRIAEKTSLVEDIQLFYTTIHAIICELMYARNFFIALYDDEKDELSFPYFVDEVDTCAFPRKPGKTLTAYVLRTGRSLLCSEKDFQELERKGEVELFGAPSPVWLGVPLVIDRKTIGAMVVQHYADERAYGEREQHILEFVSSQVAKAIEHKRAEEALRKSEERYRLLIENSSDAVILIGEDGTILYSSPTTTKLLGYEIAEFVGRNVFEFMHPDHLRDTEEAFHRVIAHPESPVMVQCRYHHKDGSWRWLEAVGRNLLAEPGIRAVVANYRDITGAKRAEAERAVMFEIIQGVSFTKDLDELLALIHRSLRKILYAENCFIALYDRATGLFSPAFYVDEFDPPFSPNRMGKSCTAYVFRTGRPLMMTQELFDRLAAEGEVELIGSNSPSWIGVPLKTSTTTIGVLVLQHYHDEHAYSRRDLEFLTSVGNQIAVAIERRRLDDVIRQSEEKYRTLFEESQDGIFVSTPEGKLIDLNPAALELFGYPTKEEVLSVDVARDLYPNPQQREAFKRSLARQGYVVNFENVLRRKDGQTRIVLETASAIRDEKGRIVAYRGFLRDITQRKKLEDQLRQAQKMEGIGTLAGGIAHDFNNLLGIILGYANLIETGRLDERKLRQSVDTIKTAVDRGAGLVRQLLTFARKADPFFESVDVNLTIGELTKMLVQTFPKTITLSQHLEEHLPGIVADATQLHQALLNLCLNARDAILDVPGSAGAGTLTLITGVIQGSHLRQKFGEISADRYVYVKVQDSGIGMDEATRNRIFEPFFTTKELGKGTGLGLAVVYGVVNSHHGFIDVESSVGKGTTFTLYFPAQAQAIVEPADGADVAAEADEEAQRGSETVLLVEDEEMLLDLLKNLLEGQGYTVLTAADGMAGLDVYRRDCDRIALVLSDMGLPKLGGWDMFQKMKEINPGVRAILASGYFDPNLKMDMLSAGAKDFIQKPYVSQEILKRIREVIDEQETVGT